MSNHPASKPAAGVPFNLNEFLHKLEAYAKDRPIGLVVRAYANGAMHLRGQAQRCQNSRDRLALQTVAVRLEQIAAQLATPLVDSHYNEEIRTFADYAGDDMGPGLPTQYDGVVADTAASKLNPDGQPVDNLVAAQQFQQMQTARENLVAPFMQINPASAREGITLFGSQALIQSGGSNSTTGSYVGANGSSGGVVAVDRARIINWEGKENDTRTVTVSIGPILQGGGATYPNATVGGTNASYRPYFRALFGASGQGQPVEVIGDIGLGVQFTIACAFLYVDVGMDPAQAGYTPGSMLVSGQMGFFAVGRHAPVQRSVYIDALANAGATQTVTVPRFAAALLPVQVVDTVPSLTMDFRDAAGTTRYSLILQAPGQLVAPVPLFGDIATIRLTNNSATASTNGMMPFLLGL